MAAAIQRGRAAALGLLPLVGLAGLLFGLLEWLYRTLGPRPPAGLAGAEGPVLLAFLALGATAFLVPALPVALLLRGAPRAVGVVVVWLAALLPTVIVYVDHLATARSIELLGARVGGLEHLLRAGLAGLLIAAVALAILWRPLRAWQRLLQRGGVAASGLAAAVGVAMAVAAPLFLWQQLPGAAPIPRGPALADRPNVLLLSIDTLRQDAVGAYGGPSTPELDRWLAEGVRFDGWAPAPWTRPSMGALFSGMPSPGNGADRDHGLNPAVDSWVERLAEAGWATSAQILNPHLKPRFGFARGFERFEHAGELERLEPIVRSVWARWWHRQILDRLELLRGDRIVDGALAWLRGPGAELERPWLLWVHLMDPHLPYNLRGAEGELHDPQPGPWLDPLRPVMTDDRFLKLDEVREGEVVTTAEEREAVRRLYRREVRFASRQAGRLLDGAKELSGERPLLWIVLSDHGEEFFEHGSFEHGHSLHRELLRVPLAMGGLPGLPPGSWGGGMRLQDVGPTVLELLGLPPLRSEAGAALPRGTALESYVAGKSRRDQIPVPPGTCAPPALIAEGTLYGPEQSRLLHPDGRSVLREDEPGRYRFYELCRDPLEEQPLAEAELDSLEQSLFLELDLWRQSAEGLGPAVEMDPELEWRLRAVGYVR